MVYKKVRLIKICLDNTQSKVRIGNYLSFSFPIENSLKQGDALSSIIINFSLEYSYAITKLQATNLGLDMNDLTCVNDVNLIGNDITTLERNTNVLLTACKDIGLAINTVKIKYVEIGCN